MIPVDPESRVPYAQRIFCNRTLRLDRIAHVGFDMDYTLAIYEDAMEFLQSKMVLKRLVEAFGYPKSILELVYEPDFAIRGLTVDLEYGNVFKMDRYRFVSRVWHGDSPLTKEARRALYNTRRLDPRDKRLAMVDTLFSFPEICLYTQLVTRFDQGEFPETPDYARLWEDLRSAMDGLHRDGSLKAEIMSDIPKYIQRDPHLSETLHRFRSAGKKLFLLTNSEPFYTNAVMSYLLDGQGEGYASWREYFDLILTTASKPAFFESDSPFLLVNDDMEVTEQVATAFQHRGIYNGGNVDELFRMFGALGDDVLYLGDHIYGDILRSKRKTSWRTCLIVPEIEPELERTSLHLREVEELEELDHLVFQAELDKAALAMDGRRDRKLNQHILELSNRTREIESNIANAFNPAWGQLFRERTELSAFGEQVEDYACVYTGRVSNFRYYSPQFYFRSPRDRMAHELRR